MDTLHSFVADITSLDNDRIRRAVVERMRDSTYGVKAQVFKQIDAKFKTQKLKRELKDKLSIRVVAKTATVYASSKHPAAGFFEYGVNMRRASTYIVPTVARVLAIPVESMDPADMQKIRVAQQQRMAAAGINEGEALHLQGRLKRAAEDYAGAKSYFRRAQQMLQFAKNRKAAWVSMPDSLKSKRAATRARKDTAREHAISLAEDYVESARTTLRERKDALALVKRDVKKYKSRLSDAWKRHRAATIYKKDGKEFVMTARARIAKGRETISPVLMDYSVNGIVVLVKGRRATFKIPLNRFEVSLDDRGRKWREG